MRALRQQLVPSRALLLLMTIGFADLIATALLHANNQIVELNPLMRPLIEKSELLFAVVKGATLIVAWVVMARYARQNREFVRTACIAGSLAYVVVWCLWFFATA